MYWFFMCQSTMFQSCRFVLMLYVPVTNFSVMSRHFTKKRIKCLVQGHSTVHQAYESLTSDPAIPILTLPWSHCAPKTKILKCNLLSSLNIWPLTLSKGSEGCGMKLTQLCDLQAIICFTIVVSGLEYQCIIKKKFCFSTKTYVVGTQKNSLNEMVLLSTQNTCLNWWIRK